MIVRRIKGKVVRCRTIALDGDVYVALTTDSGATAVVQLGDYECINGVESVDMTYQIEESE